MKNINGNVTVLVGPRHCSIVQDGNILRMNPTQTNALMNVISAWLKSDKVKNQVKPMSINPRMFS